MVNSALLPVTSIFDELFDDLGTKTFNVDTQYPKYNVYDDGEDAFISVAVTGIPEEKIQIYMDDSDYLVIEANPQKDTRNYQHKGYPIKSFKKRFWIDNRFNVGSAVVENGELVIRLNRTKPKRRNIEIITSNSSNTPEIETAA